MQNPTKKLTKMSILSAMGIILMLAIHIPIIPSAPFLEYDPSDVVILIASFMFGPVSGLTVTFVISLIQWLFVSPQSGIWGFIMHFIASGTLAMVSGIFYLKNKSFKGAVFSLLIGSLSMIIIMIPLNLIITPIYTKAPIDVVSKLILPAIIPFNAFKAVFNSALTLLLYKQIKKLFNKIYYS